MCVRMRWIIIVISESSHTWPWGQWCAGQQGSTSKYRLLLPLLGGQTSAKGRRMSKDSQRRNTESKGGQFLSRQFGACLRNARQPIKFLQGSWWDGLHAKWFTIDKKQSNHGLTTYYTWKGKLRWQLHKLIAAECIWALYWLNKIPLFPPISKSHPCHSTGLLILKQECFKNAGRTREKGNSHAVAIMMVIFALALREEAWLILKGKKKMNKVGNKHQHHSLALSCKSAASSKTLNLDQIEVLA